MAYAAEHGPPALDATHQWTPATGVAPPVLNATYGYPVTLPCVAVDRINNWRGLPELVDNRAPRTFNAGEITYPARRLGKTLVYECRLQGDAREVFILAQNALVQGFVEQSDEGTMTVAPWASPGGVIWTYTARVLDLQFDQLVNTELNVGFTLTLRMSDARFFTGGIGYY